MTRSEQDEVRATALDYFEGWYDADVDRVDRALHPDLVKRRGADRNGDRVGPVSDKPRMLALTAAGGGAEDRTDEPIEVEVADIHGHIASAVVRSAQYREYLHLVRTPDGWRVVDALWCLTEDGSR